MFFVFPSERTFLSLTEILKSLMMFVLCALTLIDKTVYILSPNVDLFWMVAGMLFKRKKNSMDFPWAPVANHVFFKLNLF